MKTKIVTIALIAMTSSSSYLVAQEAATNSVGYDLKKNVTCRVSPTETGFSIVFEHNVKTPLNEVDNRSLETKGREYAHGISEYSVHLADNTITEVTSPRDAASGLATGKRQHKPYTITSTIDKSTPILYKSVSGNETTADGSLASRSGGGAGKVNIQDISFTKRCAGTTMVLSVVDNECVIPTGDCPNGVCILTMDWIRNDASASTEIGSSGMDGVTRSSVSFLLEIEDGVCTAMAINEKGLPGEKKPKKTKSKN